MFVTMIKPPELLRSVLIFQVIGAQDVKYVQWRSQTEDHEDPQAGHQDGVVVIRVHHPVSMPS